jgi:hypothetical protein
MFPPGSRFRPIADMDGCALLVAIDFPADAGDPFSERNQHGRRSRAGAGLAGRAGRAGRRQGPGAAADRLAAYDTAIREIGVLLETTIHRGQPVVPAAGRGPHAGVSSPR